MTITDVARLAQVSPTTVSHALSGRRPVSRATREKVDRAIRELDFRPNEVARAFRRQTSQSVAVVIGNIVHASYQAFAPAVTEVMHPRGYQTALYDVADDPAYQTDTVRAILDRSIDGVMFFGVSVSEEDFQLLRKAETPIVEVKQEPPSPHRWDIVGSDAQTGVRQLTSLIATATDGPVAFLGGPEGDRWTPGRLEGFRREMADLGREVREDLIFFGDYTRESGERMLDQAVARTPRPVAAICGNDLIAIGAMLHALDLGMDVPGDIAFAGFDNIEACLMVRPKLTSIEAFERLQGELGARMLLDRIEGTYSGPARLQIVPTELRLRDSTPAPR